MSDFIGGGKSEWNDENGELVPKGKQPIRVQRMNDTIYASEYDSIDAAFADLGGSTRHLHVDSDGAPYTVQNPPITVDGFVKVTGDGWTSDNGYQGSVIEVASDVSLLEQVAGDAPSYTSRMHLEDVAFVGAGKTSGTAAGLTFGEVRGLLFDNVGVFEFGGDGVDLQTGLRARFHRCRFERNGASGLHFTGSLNASTIITSRAHANGRAGVRDSGNGTSLFVVDNSTLEGNDQFGIEKDSSANIVSLENTWLESNGTDNARFTPGADIITDLSVERCNVVGSDPPSGYGLRFGDGGSGSIERVTVKGCRVSNSAGTYYDSMVSDILEINSAMGSRTDNAQSAVHVRGNQTEYRTDNARIAVMQKPNYGNAEIRSTFNSAIEVLDRDSNTLFALDERNGNVSDLAGAFSTGSPTPFNDGLSLDANGPVDLSTLSPSENNIRISDGTNLTAGPAWYDGATWHSLIDGSTF